MSAPFDFAGRAFLVTGGARGIGLAVAEAAIAAGANVLLFDRELAETKAAAEQLGKRAAAFAGDVRDEIGCERAASQMLEQFGRFDVLVNNAGVFENIRGTAKQDLAAWRQVIDVNLQGSFLMARAAARVMQTQGNGAIVNFASVNGLTGFRASNAYGVSKAAVAMLTQTLAGDLAPRGIRVNAVAPGFIDTPMTEMIFGERGVDRMPFLQRIPMGRFGSPAEIANAVLFLASPLASYITGTVLPVDGGWCAFGGPSEPGDR
jgi:NAD(P)-dependent dehydrogenase (short-subunit alcohol dehydrogenase family)